MHFKTERRLKNSPDGRGGYRLRVEYEDAPTIIDAIEHWARISQGQGVEIDDILTMIQIANDLRNMTTTGLDYTGLDPEKIKLLADILRDHVSGSEYLAGLHNAVKDIRFPKHESQSSVEHHERTARAAANMAVYLGVVRELLDAPETGEMDGDLNK